MINLRTNLDQVIIPDYKSPYLPPKGAIIVCSINSRPVRLEVFNVTYYNGNWEVELHIPQSYNGMSIREWYKQYGVYI